MYMPCILSYPYSYIRLCLVCKNKAWLNHTYTQISILICNSNEHFYEVNQNIDSVLLVLKKTQQNRDSIGVWY